MTDNAPLVLISFGIEFLALTPTELAQARERAREVLGAGRTGDRAAAPSGAPEELLTAQELEAVTRIPAPWYLERARQGQIPHVRLGRYPRFLLSKVVEHGLVTPPAEAGGNGAGRRPSEPREGRRDLGVERRCLDHVPDCGLGLGPFDFSIREVWIRSLFGPPYLLILPICPVCGARVPRR